MTDLETGMNFYKDFDGYERKGFIRKVYGILSVQLSVTTLFVLWAMVSESFRLWMHNNIWFLIVCVVGTMALLISLFCFKNAARKVPTNYIILMSFTVLESFLVANFTAYYEPELVLAAMLLTAGITLGVTIYALTTKKDFTYCYGILFGLLLGGIVFGLVFGFLLKDFETMHVLICLAYIVIYTLYIVIDTQLIAGGKRYELGFDDYIVGALFLYIDIIGLFIYILSLIGGRR